jgi:hypothetical protein
MLTAKSRRSITPYIQYLRGQGPKNPTLMSGLIHYQLACTAEAAWDDCVEILLLLIVDRLSERVFDPWPESCKLANIRKWSCGGLQRPKNPHRYFQLFIKDAVRRSASTSFEAEDSRQ